MCSTSSQLSKNHLIFLLAVHFASDSGKLFQKDLDGAGIIGTVPPTPSKMQDPQVCILICFKATFACSFWIAHQLV